MINYICPVCKGVLSRSNNSYRCKKNHCFDVAKEGYINLLPIKSKKSKDPGDNNKMIMARRSFLESHNYRPLAINLSDKIKELLKDKKTASILDLGCGEGYYSGIIVDNLPGTYSIAGLDISKVAVKYGSKRYKNINFCVASAFELPIKDNSVDLLYRIYAPSSEKELNRVIKKGGYLVTVTPGDRHLYQLREIIYKEVLNLSTKEDESKSFKNILSDNLHYNMAITDKNVVQDLLDMTPFGWKISKNSHEKLLIGADWNIECDFKIDVFKKIL